MAEPEIVRVVRRSPGRLRLHAPTLIAGESAGIEQIAAAHGVLDVRLSPRTQNVLIEFDPDLIEEPELLALAAARPRAQSRRRPRGDAKAPVETGWLRGERSETLHARPAECVAVLLEFERYPEWQTYVTSVSVYERDDRGRGILVRARARAGEREIDFTTRYRYPSSNRVVFEQDDPELGAVRGSWAFRSAAGRRTRATCVLEVKPGRRLTLLLRGSLFERIREAGLDHVMDELRGRVEGERVSPSANG